MSRKITRYITFSDKTFLITQGIFTWELKMILCFEYPHKMQNIVYLFKSLQCHLRKEYETKLNIRGLN